MNRTLIPSERSNRTRFYFVFVAIILMLAGTVSAQTNTFTYQGRLTDNNLAAVGTYEMQFRVFDAAVAGNQLPVGTPVTLNFTVAGTNPITVSNGAFTVQLNFGNGVFTGADRWLDISVRKPSDPPGFTLLTPRQPITSSPYSIKTLNANAADSLSSACVLCITDAQISGIAGGKVIGNVASATTAATAGNVTGVVGIANGGTGANSAANARTNLGLGTLATLSPTGTADTTTFLRGDNTWGTAGGSGLRVFDANSNLIGFVIGFTNNRIITVMNPNGYVFELTPSGSIPGGPFYWNGGACGAGTPILWDGGSVPGVLRYSKFLTYSPHSDKLYTMASPNADGESTSSTLFAGLGLFFYGSAGCASALGAPSKTGWFLTPITAAAVGLPVVAGTNHVAAPLQFQ